MPNHQWRQFLKYGTQHFYQNWVGIDYGLEPLSSLIPGTEISEFMTDRNACIELLDKLVIDKLKEASQIQQMETALRFQNI